MNRLRAGLLAVAVALMASCSMVLSTGTAFADPLPVDPRIAYQQPVQWPTTPQEAYNNIVAYLSGNRSCQDALCGPGADQAGAPFAVLDDITEKIGGTPNEVAVGTKLASKACKTGYGCIGALAAAYGMSALGLSELFAPWVQQFGEGPPPVPAPVYYASTRGSSPYGCNQGPPTGLTWDSQSVTFHCLKSWAGGGGVVVASHVAVDYVEKATGTWFHQGYSFNIGAGAADEPYTLNPLGSGHSNTQYELRRMHFVEDSTINSIVGNSFGWDKGFYWGQELPPAAGNIESLTRCQRPNGSTYDVVALEPVSSGLAAVPACEAGDTPIFTQTTLIDPDGTRHPQTAQRLDTKPAADEAFPLCVSGGCYWKVKVNGVECTVGAAACIEWARDKTHATCWYGPYQLPIGLCYPYERSYEPGVEVPITDDNTDGDPDTHDGPEPELQPITPTPTATVTTTTTTSPTTSPTSTPTSTPTSSPTTSPTTDPSGGPSPTPTGSTPPGEQPCTSGQACPDPSGEDQSAECYPSGWGVFNPVGWVLKPIRCAFEPDPVKTRAQVDRLSADLGTVGPVPMITAMSTAIGGASTGGGCQGPGMTIDLAGVHKTLYLFNACDAPMSTVAGYVKAFATVVIVFGGGLAIIRALGAGFGFNFSMGRGKDDD